jgi:glycosyltransferase involved in cell wall biosynthesis
MLRVLAFSGGPNNGSRIPRVQQYIPYLRVQGIDITENNSRAGLFPPDPGLGSRMVWAFRNLVEHLPATVLSYRYDLTLLQREMLSTFVTFEPFTKHPRVLDVDDAIWVHRGGGFARRLAATCDHVICGNRFLAENFSKWNPNVSVLPTAVDTNRFIPNHGIRPQSRKIIGWLGLSSGYQYFAPIESALARVLQNHPECCLRIVSDKPPEFHAIPRGQVEYVPYSRELEAGLIQDMTIGIMPLDDTDVCRGKCSYKMIQYMSCGIPVVVSPIGMNVEILQQGELGFGASRPPQWVDALEALLANPALCQRLGRKGRQVAQSHFDVRVLAPRLAHILRSQVEPSPVSHPCVAS